jgi:subtilisin family serine protease
VIEAGGSAESAAARAAGRFVVTFADEVDDADRQSTLRSLSGVADVVSTEGRDMHAMDLGEAMAAEAVVFARSGVAVVNASTAQVAALRSTARVIAARPARIYQVLDDPAVGLADYLRGRRDELDDLCLTLGLRAVGTAAQMADRASRDTAQLTWGLQVTGMDTSIHTGRGVRIAVLDTGLDLTHPDFAGRPVTARSFVPAPGSPDSMQGPQDGHGHGTHCTGTATGPATPPTGRRYGVAAEAGIFIGKVLDDDGFGDDTSILAGLEWALDQQCAVVSMSLGADVRTVDPAYEAVGRRALDAGSLIVAAAGNNANRTFGDPGFVGVPANSPSIMAIGAVDPGLQIAPFSARSQPVDGGQVDLAAPGVAVYSTWPMPIRYNTLQGTSMATPHVAGIAAVWAEATGRRGRELWSTLVQQARRLDQPSADVGAGLVQAQDP